MYVQDVKNYVPESTIPQSNGGVNGRSGMPATLRAEMLTRNGESLTVEEAKAASGYGDYGAEVLAGAVNNAEGQTFSQVKGDMHNAYLAGRVNKGMRFETDLQREAYYAGKKDAELGRLIAKKKAGYTTVYGEESGFIPNDASKNVSPKMQKALNLVAKDLGVKVMFADNIFVNKKGDQANAAMGDDGIFRISANSTQPLYELIIHEPFHRMRQLATQEYFDAMNFAVQHAEQLGLRLEQGNGAGTYYEALNNLFTEKGISHDDAKILDELAAQFYQKIVSNDADALRFIQEMNKTEKSRSALQKFMDYVKELIGKLQKAVRKLRNQGEYAAAKQMDITIKELETARKFYLNAYQATRQRVENRRVEQTWDVMEDANSDENSVAKNPAKEYNGEVSYSLYTDDVMFSSRYNKVTQSQDMRELYNGAKRGDVRSAHKLLSKLLSEDVISEIGSFGNDVYLMPVVGAEGTSTNVLPQIIAEHICVKTGQSIFDGIYKEDASDSRNVNIWGRMKENYPSFVFDENSNVKTNDISGRKFVLIDDNSTTGRTFVGLKNFLEENGGEVVGYYALTTGQDQSEKMVTTDETWNTILSIGLDDVRGFAEKEGVKREISKLGLTEREAQELIKQFRNKKGNTGRGVKDASRGERSGGEVQAIPDAEKKRGVGEQDLSLKDEVEVSPRRTKELLDTIAYLKGQFETTKFAKADPQKLRSMTRKLLKEYSSNLNLGETTTAMEELYRYMANGENGHPAAWDETFRRAKEIAARIAESALETGTNPEKALEFARKKAADFLLQSNDRRYGELIAIGNYAEIVGYIDQFIKNMYQLDDMSLITRNIYWDSYGEKESRSVQERFENQLTTGQRREHYPNYEKGAISKNEGEEPYEGNDLSRSAVNSESRTQGKVWENKTSGLDVREDAEATNGRRGEEGAGASEVNYALDENGMLEMEQDLSL